MTDITVIKKNIHGEETIRYKGKILKRNKNCIVLEAFFNRTDMLINGMPINNGDRFVEIYYTNRWYNIFEIHAREDDHLRGWYCNITSPAKINLDSIAYTDLALDLLVFPDGKQVVLDMEEYQMLRLPPKMDAKAKQALIQLRSKFKQQLAQIIPTIDALSNSSK